MCHDWLQMPQASLWMGLDTYVVSSVHSDGRNLVWDNCDCDTPLLKSGFPQMMCGQREGHSKLHLFMVFSLVL